FREIVERFAAPRSDQAGIAGQSVHEFGVAQVRDREAAAQGLEGIAMEIPGGGPRRLGASQESHQVGDVPQERAMLDGAAWPRRFPVRLGGRRLPEWRFPQDDLKQLYRHHDLAEAPTAWLVQNRQRRGKQLFYPVPRLTHRPLGGPTRGHELSAPPAVQPCRQVLHASGPAIPQQQVQNGLTFFRKLLNLRARAFAIRGATKYGFSQGIRAAPEILREFQRLSNPFELHRLVAGQ